MLYFKTWSCMFLKHGLKKKKERESYKARTLGLQCYEVGEMKRKGYMRLKARS